VGALLPLPARGAPAAVGVHVDVGGDARARVPGDHRDDAVPRRHRPGVDAQRAPRRRDGPRPRGGLEALHRHPGREDQRAAVTDGFDGFVVHLANHDVTLSAVSRTPLAKLQAYKRRMGWTFPWASSLGSDFNLDFNVWFSEEQQREGSIEYNYRRGGHAMDATSVPEPVAELAATVGTDAATYTRERPGVSAFALEDGVVYHTYSAYARGVDGLWGVYQWLDRAPKGRNETGVWMRRHDEYNKG